MGRVHVELEPLGDRVMVVPVQVDRGTGIVGVGGEIVKPESTKAAEEWQQSEVVVFKHGTGVPKWLQKKAPEGTTVVIARHTASMHRIPIGSQVVEFLLVPSHGVLMVKEMVPVEDAEEAGTVETVHEPECPLGEIFPDRDKTGEAN